MPTPPVAIPLRLPERWSRHSMHTRRSSTEPRRSHGSLAERPDPEGLRRGVIVRGRGTLEAADSKEGLLHQPGVIEVASAESQSARASALYAPGREYSTLLPGGHYDFASGDSIATAQVSGVVALLLAKKAGLSAASIYQLLRDTSTRSDAARG